MCYHATMDCCVPAWLSLRIIKAEKEPIVFSTLTTKPGFGIQYSLKASRIHSFLLEGAYFSPAQLCALVPGFISMEDGSLSLWAPARVLSG